MLRFATALFLLGLLVTAQSALGAPPANANRSLRS